MPLDRILTLPFIVGTLAASIRLATPLLLAALGETFSERSGVLNIGTEGIMIVGALAGFLGGHFSGSPWVGALCAVVAGALVSCLHAYLSAVVSADQVVSGLATNLLALGASIFVFRAVFGITTANPESPTFHRIAIPGLSAIPVLGEVLFTHHAWVYIAWILVPVSHLVLFRTTWGLKVTAVGENPLAAEAAGVDVRRVRFAAVVIGGALAGLGGMTLSLSQLGFFKEAMVAGRGFIAIAIVTLGRWTPLGVLGGALLFGIADSLQFRLQSISTGVVPPEVLLSLPYALAILVVLASVGRNVIPSALAVRYEGSEHR